MKLGLYIHIPFCRQKCLYCDFPSHDNLAHLYQDYIDALCREIAEQGRRFAGWVVDTVYIGGGTPTVLPSELLGRVFASLAAAFSLEPAVEITVEANPGTIDLPLLKALRAWGVNRLSFGVQTFVPHLLPLLGRVHTAEQGIEAVELARAAGFDNINLDLMYGLPEQRQADVADSLSRATELGVPHLSVYGLKVEEGTPFAVSHAAGKLALPDETEEEAMYDLVTAFLRQAGYRRYEVSNYCRPGYECRHNLKYWHYQPFLGLGAAAYSFVDGVRWANTPQVVEYIQAQRQGALAVHDREVLDRQTQIAEFIFLALRTAAGLDSGIFQERFGHSFWDAYRATIDTLSQRGLVERCGNRLRLTDLGMKFGNIVFASFLPDKA